ncbi:hypothetical protein ACQPZ2_29165 [Nocardia pseudovaccinii]|uniref:hypothetical protein n=1 Tax=Nocardia pseudovaccinii TaxID=189540 RepID=UPI003D8F6911
MLTVNHRIDGEGEIAIHTTMGSLDLPAARGHDDVLMRVKNLKLSRADSTFLRQSGLAVAGTERFHDVIRTFAVPEGHTPPGFRVDATLKGGGLVEVDLIRDIGYDWDSMRRPTGVIYSADSANPYEVAPIAGLLGNLTCNPGIVYDLFLNNPEANIGNHFTSLTEVMTELGSTLGPGVDVSVELENPFEPDFEKILAEIEPYKKILSPYRLVVKVPHTGPVNAENVNRLLSGDKRLPEWYAAPRTEDAFRSHNLALRLREKGYRVNYTLMFEPYQAALALQAKPYFINAFVRHRLLQSKRILALVRSYHDSRDKKHLMELRDYLASVDHIVNGNEFEDLVDILHYAENILAYRKIDSSEGADGLDNLRHILRLLKQTNLTDTRVIACSMEGTENYPDIDKLMVEPEFSDVINRLVITAEPSYLARFTSASQVVSYQRRFMSAAASH